MSRFRRCRAPLAALAVAGLFALAPASQAERAADSALVFASNRAENLYSELYTVGVDGRGRRNITRNPHADRIASPSPAGGLVAFVSDRAGADGVYVMRPDGNGKRLLLRLRGRRIVQAPLSWSPQGNRLLVRAWRTNSLNRIELYLVPLRGRVTRLSSDASAADWSPSGARIAYQAPRTPTVLDDEVRVVDLSGRLLWKRPGAEPNWSARGRLALATPRRGGIEIYSSGGRSIAAFPGSGSAWSPDGGRIAYIHGEALYVAGVDGRRALKLASLRGAVVVPIVPEWSPDGSRIAYLAYDAGFHIVPARGGRPVHITGVPAAWAPDGTRLAFLRFAAGEARLIVARPDGTAVQRVASERYPSEIVGVTWLAGGRKLLIESQAGNRGSDLYRIGADGRELRPLTRSFASEESPAWSPDGTLIAYSRSERAGLDCKGCAARIYVIGTDGRSARRLTDHADYIYDESPAWSPDGRRIAFSRSSVDDPSRIYVMNVDGSAETNLTPNADGRDPAWSPDGKLIAFASTRAGGGILVIGADGGTVRKIAGRMPAGAERTGSPTWSPDGSRVAFAGGDGIYVVPVDGSAAPTRIVARAGVSQLSWSPDGRQIAFAATCADCLFRGSNSDVYVVAADGAGLIRLTRDPANDAGPDWQRGAR